MTKRLTENEKLARKIARKILNSGTRIISQKIVGWSGEVLRTTNCLFKDDLEMLIIKILERERKKR